MTQFQKLKVYYNLSFQTPYDPYSNGDLDRQQNNNFPEDIIVDPPKTTFPSPVENNNNNNVNRNQNNFGTRSPTSFFAQPGTMAGMYVSNDNFRQSKYG